MRVLAGVLFVLGVILLAYGIWGASYNLTFLAAGGFFALTGICIMFLAPRQIRRTQLMNEMLRDYERQKRQR